MNREPQPNKWTPALVVRTVIYLTVITLLLVTVPEFRHGIGYLLTQIAGVVCFVAGGFVALLLMVGMKPPRR